jgi:hypothetical protein
MQSIRIADFSYPDVLVGHLSTPLAEFPVYGLSLTSERLLLQIGWGFEQSFAV